MMARSFPPRLQDIFEAVLKQAGARPESTGTKLAGCLLSPFEQRFPIKRRPAGAVSVFLMVERIPHMVGFPLVSL